MRRVVLVAGAALLVVGSLAGCAGAEGAFSSGDTSASVQPSVKPSVESGSNLSDEIGVGDTMFYQELPTGAKVLCVLVTDDSAHGEPALSCDWNNAQGLNKSAPKS